MSRIWEFLSEESLRYLASKCLAMMSWKFWSLKNSWTLKVLKFSLFWESKISSTSLAIPALAGRISPERPGAGGHGASQRSGADWPRRPHCSVFSHRSPAGALICAQGGAELPSAVNVHLVPVLLHLQTDVVVLRVLYLYLLDLPIDDGGSSDGEGLLRLDELPIQVLRIFHLQNHLDAHVLPRVYVPHLQQPSLYSQNIKVSQRLQVISVVAGGGGEDWVECADECRDREVAPAEGIGSTAQEQEAHTHVDGHIESIVRRIWLIRLVVFDPLPEDPDESEAVNVAGACHHHAEAQGADTEAGLGSVLVDQVLLLGTALHGQVLLVGLHDLQLPVELDDGGNETEHLLVPRASVLEAQRQDCPRYDVDVAQRDRGKVDVVLIDPLRVVLLHQADIILIDVLDDVGDLGVDPVFGALNVVPHDEVLAEDLQHEEVGADEL
eukprot:CAMPEP_0170565756 /NCGR_PEP_ID=MMETSP0211-20121228/79392_1 /TAXON_ID=311385 /ORGANISM="Pseudokeronopsis sp., Strain OXSARD2" /LENGTH=438 /DNA_ID=CAMNT_0010886717 /DNA_START=518 /DNA_END=1836 /DNA_ORIENTATION=+